jgi:hypothetical protein
MEKSMLHRFVIIAIWVSSVAGCASEPANRRIEPIPAAPELHTPISGISEPVLPDQVELLSPDEQKAISVATMALERRPGNAGYSLRKDLAYVLHKTDQGWIVQVFPFGRDSRTGQPVITPGDFVNVTMDEHWIVTGIMGGV